MNILFLNAYYKPEKIAYSHLEEDIIASLVENGHRVEIICPTPSRGIDKAKRKEYKKRKREQLYDGKVLVRRFACPKEKSNPIIRAIRYFWCNWREYSISKKYKNIDCVFAVSTPPTQGLLGVKVAKKLSKKYKKHVSFVYNLQDVFPDSLVTTGLAKEKSLIWKIGRKIENNTYNGADKIIVISESMKSNILAKGVSKEKVLIVSNWIDTDVIVPVEKDNNELFEQFNISRDKFVVVYAGNFGKAQGADIILQTAELLKEEKDIKFVIFGGGSEFELAKEKAKNMNNVFIHPLLSDKKTAEVYSLGDVSLITCKKGVGTSGMPSKTWNIMACNTPIIASFDTDSELAKILDYANAGLCVPPEDAKALASAIIKAKTNKIKNGGREYVIKYASRANCVEKYVKEIEKLQ